MEQRDKISHLKDLIKHHENEKIKQYLLNENVYSLISKHGENLLHLACACNNFLLCEYLIKEKNLHVNLENFQGTTPLYYAAIGNCVEAAEVLLKYNANPNIRSGFSGKFPIEVTTNQKLKRLFQEKIDKMFSLDRKSKSDPYLMYTYRLYMLWLKSLHHYNNSGTQKNVEANDLIPEAKEIYQKGGTCLLAQKCQKLYDNYVRLLTKPDHLECLYCSNRGSLIDCNKCRSVFYCNLECQIKGYGIHKFDCY